MDAFWEFVNKRSVRFVLAAFCILLAIQGVTVLSSPGTDGISSGEREKSCYGGHGDWSISFGPRGRVMQKLNIVVNIGIVMLLISWFAAR